MAAPFMTPVSGQPGTFFIPVLGKTIRIVEYREDNKYDTVVAASGAQSDGAQKVFFRDLTNKQNVDTNFSTPRRIGNGESMLIKWIGLHVADSCGATPAVPADVKKILWGTFFEFKINRKLICQGTSIYFPAGYGLAGNTVENGAGVVANGVPSTASVRTLERPFEITDQHDLDATLTWQDHTWDATNLPSLTNKCYVRATIHGLIRENATTT